MATDWSRGQDPDDPADDFDEPQPRPKIQSQRLGSQFSVVEDAPYSGPSLDLPMGEWISQSKALTASRIAQSEQARAADSKQRMAEQTRINKERAYASAEVLPDEEQSDVDAPSDDDALEPEGTENARKGKKQLTSTAKAIARESSVGQPYDVESPKDEDRGYGVGTPPVEGLVPSGAEFDTSPVAAEEAILLSPSRTRLPRDVRLGSRSATERKRTPEEIEASAAARLALEGDIGVRPEWAKAPKPKKKSKKKAPPAPATGRIGKPSEEKEVPLTREERQAKAAAVPGAPASELSEQAEQSRFARAESAALPDGAYTPSEEKSKALGWYRSQSAPAPAAAGSPEGETVGNVTFVEPPSGLDVTIPRGLTAPPGLKPSVTTGLEQGGIARREREALEETPGLGRLNRGLRRLATSISYLDEDEPWNAKDELPGEDERRPRRMVYNRETGKIRSSLPQETEKVPVTKIRGGQAEVDPNTGAVRRTVVSRPGTGREMTPAATAEMLEQGADFDPYAIEGGVADITAAHMAAVREHMNATTRYRELKKATPRGVVIRGPGRPPVRLPLAQRAAELATEETAILGGLMAAPSAAPKRGPEAAGVTGTGQKIIASRRTSVPNPSALARVRTESGDVVGSPYRSATQVPTRGGATAVERARSMGLIRSDAEVTEEQAAGMVAAATEAERRRARAPQAESRRAAMEINARRIDEQGNLVEGQPAPIPPSPTGSLGPTGRGGNRRTGDTWGGVPPTRSGRLAWRRPRANPETPPEPQS